MINGSNAKKQIFEFSILLLIACILSFYVVNLSSCSGKDKFNLDNEINDVHQYFVEKSGAEEGKLFESRNVAAGEPASNWMAITLKASGCEEDYSNYKKVLEREIVRQYEEQGGLGEKLATDWQRTILAFVACGGNPIRVGKTSEGKEINLIADGIYDWNQTDDIGSQGNNAVIYGLLALDSKNFETPEKCRYGREELLTKLFSHLNSSGTFGQEDDQEANIDMTAMALQALAPYYLDKELSGKEYILKDGKSISIKDFVNKSLEYLSENQQAGGMYIAGDGYASESISQVIIALCSLGIDPAKDERFIKTGRSTIDALMQFKKDDGGFSHTLDGDDELSNESEFLSTQQAGLAFAAIKKFREDKKRVFDFNR